MSKSKRTYFDPAAWRKRQMQEQDARMQYSTPRPAPPRPKVKTAMSAVQRAALHKAGVDRALDGWDFDR